VEEDPIDVFGSLKDAGPDILVRWEDLIVNQVNKPGKEILLEGCQVECSLMPLKLSGEALKEVGDASLELDWHSAWVRFPV